MKERRVLASKSLKCVAGGEREAIVPSPFLRKYGELLVRAAAGYPILDVACGGGRNSVLLASLGARVIGIDIDLDRSRLDQGRLTGASFEEVSHLITFVKHDLIREPWPFEAQSIGGVINIHFLHIPLLRLFSDCLIPGGCLLLETIGGHGENFQELPKAGTLRSALRSEFSFLTYQERKSGPSGANAVSVKLFAIREHPNI